MWAGSMLMLEIAGGVVIGLCEENSCRSVAGQCRHFSTYPLHLGRYRPAALNRLGRPQAVPPLAVAFATRPPDGTASCS
jgi:hypothetical protein